MAVFALLVGAALAAAGVTSAEVALPGAAVAPNRFAYVTIHYEGTPADAEYVLGIRVLLQSLKPLQHPFIVLASSSVSAETRALLTAEGATIRPVHDMDNPFGHVLARFAHTFNKLYLWNMTEFDRLIYLDADNVAVRTDLLNSLFHCGHFCVVYMNPCHFHTGLMVVRPDAALYGTMVQRLAEVGSYDGADQGFLSSFFVKCWKAPLFNPKLGRSDEPMNALHIGYNMHAIYYFANGRLFERLKCGPFADEPGLAVATIGFPLPTIIKPWYWWTPLAGHTREWDDARSQLTEPGLLLSVAVRLAGLAVLFVGSAHGLHHVLFSRAPVPSQLSRWVGRVGAAQAARLFGVASLLLAGWVAGAVTPPTLPNKLGALLFSATLCATFLCCVQVLNWAVFLHQPPAPGAHVWAQLREARWFILSLVLLWACEPMHMLYELLFGLGIHVVLLHAIVSLVVVANTAVAIVGHVAAPQPARLP